MNRTIEVSPPAMSGSLGGSAFEVKRHEGEEGLGRLYCYAIGAVTRELYELVARSHFVGSEAGVASTKSSSNPGWSWLCVPEDKKSAVHEAVRGHGCPTTKPPKGLVRCASHSSITASPMERGGINLVLAKD